MVPEIDPRAGRSAAAPASAASRAFDARWSEWQRRAGVQDAVRRRRVVVTTAVVGSVLTGWLALALYLG